MEKKIKIKHLWIEPRDEGKESLFILTEDDELTEYIDIKVVKIEDGIQGEDISNYSDDGGVTVNLTISKPKII